MFQIATWDEGMIDSSRTRLHDQLVELSVVVDVIFEDSVGNIGLEVIQLEDVESREPRNLRCVFVNADKFAIRCDFHPLEHPFSTFTGGFLFFLLENGRVFVISWVKTEANPHYSEQVGSIAVFLLELFSLLL